MGLQESYLGVLALKLPAHEWSSVCDGFIAAFAASVHGLSTRAEQDEVHQPTTEQREAPSHVEAGRRRRAASAAAAARTGLQSLLADMWCVEPSARPSAYDIVRLPFWAPDRFVFKAPQPP